MPTPTLSPLSPRLPHNPLQSPRPPSPSLDRPTRQNSPHIRVVAALIPECRYLPMPREQGGVIRKLHDLSYRGHQVLHRASRQVRPPDRPADDQVSAHERLLFGKVKADMARAMPRRKHHPRAQRSHRHRLSIFEVARRLARWHRKRQPKQCRSRLLQLLFIQLVDQFLHARKRLRHNFMVRQMIPVPVRHPQRLHDVARALGLLQQWRHRVVRRIDQHGLLRQLISHQKTVRRGQAAPGRHNLHTPHYTQSVPPAGIVVPMLRWGILSTGNIARQFAGSFKTAQHGKLQAVASRAADAARSFAANHAIASSYGDYTELLRDPTVDAVYNALPNHLHHHFTLAALRAGKHVLCEKPIAMSLAQAQEMFDVADQNGKLLVEAFMYRSHPLTKAYLAAVRAGMVGQVRLLRASFSFKVTKPQGNIRFDPALGGGVLMDVGCYCIDFARMITGTAPDRMHAVATFGDTGVDTSAAVTLGHPDGSLASFSVAMTAHADNTTSICGTDGYIEIPIPWKPPVIGAVWRFGQSTPTKMDQAANPAAPPAPPAKQTHTVDAGKDLYALEADDFALAVIGKIPPAVSKAESLDNARTMERVKASLP